MVMTEDQPLRRNRLALLREIAGLFAGLARFNHLQL
jgi:glycyl-tRNA synthetase beta subunit